MPTVFSMSKFTAKGTPYSKFGTESASIWGGLLENLG